MTNGLMEAKQELQHAQDAEQTRSRRAFVPKTDIYETNESLLLLVDMPGVNQDSVDITLEQNTLTIFGSVEPLDFEGYSLAYAEYGIGDYRRVFTISNEIDRDAIEASVKNGVLKLMLPKNKRSMPRKISVQSD